MAVRTRSAASSARPLAQGSPRQLAVGHHPLPGDEALAALPGMEAPAGEDGRGIRMAADAVEQRHVLDGQVVALQHELASRLEVPQPGRRGIAEPLAELVVLVEDTRVRRVRAQARGGRRPGRARAAAAR